MRKFISEPLVHFLVLGTVIFAAAQLVSDDEPFAVNEIVVGADRIEGLATVFARTWQRPPNESELQGLISEFVREEIYYREALALGLDQDDIIVRRRLRQKLEFLSEDLAATDSAPTDAELAAHLEAHPDRFQTEVRFSFVQVPVDEEGDPGELLALLREAGTDVDTSPYGGLALLEREHHNVSAPKVAMQFGDNFTARLSEVPLGQWQGPIPSSYGAHLVLISERSAAALPSLETIRERVRLDLADVRRQRAAKRFYESLRQRYQVTVEFPNRTSDAAYPEAS